jgi:hypothetical protein
VCGGESRLSDGRMESINEEKKEGEARQGQKANSYPLRIKMINGN